MKPILHILLMILFVSALSYTQAQSERKYHAFSGTVGITAEAGMLIGLTDYPDIKPEIMGRGSIEYFFPTTSSGIFSIRGFYSAGYIGGQGLDDSEIYPSTFRATTVNVGGGLSYTFSIEQAVFPFIFLGGSYQWFNPKDASGNSLPYAGRSFEGTDVNYHAEAGIKFLLSKAISLNFTAGSQFSSADNWDALPSSSGNDLAIYALGGLTFAIGASSDTDGDGVKDQDDQCADTPQGVAVDEYGCPVDTDSDGVPDYLDKCPNTKAGMQVDEYGCVIDSDGDGVIDTKDRCPNTPKGIAVNEFGCPDSDADGIPDNEDKCPDTPKGARVDDRGCPVDSDGDGVPDYKDKCPNTPRGEQVDETGCSTQKDTVMIKEEVVTLSGDTNFEFNKSNLLPSAYTVLNQLSESMKSKPETRWRVEGHTDAIGSDSYNMDLSRSRAESVVNYLVSKEIDRNRLEIVPLGKSSPIASNDTQEGRSMNRRVEIKLIK
jgi:OmpA-OmpF porin, OOP family